MPAPLRHRLSSEQMTAGLRRCPRIVRSGHNGASQTAAGVEARVGAPPPTPTLRRERLRDDLRLGLRRPASPPACPRNHLDPAEVPSVSVKRMVIHMVKPIPMTESGPSRITIAHAMWGRNYAYIGQSLHMLRLRCA